MSKVRGRGCVNCGGGGGGGGGCCKCDTVNCKSLVNKVGTDQSDHAEVTSSEHLIGQSHFLSNLLPDEGLCAEDCKLLSRNAEREQRVYISTTQLSLCLYTHTGSISAFSLCHHEIATVIQQTDSCILFEKSMLVH